MHKLTALRQYQGIPNVKRQYRRRPRVDENAPTRPHSAYFTFASRIRSQNESADIGFVDLSKETGRQWREMSPTDKEARQAEATLQKQTYNARFREYMKTDQYQQYQQYLVDFRRSQSIKNAVGFESHPASDTVPEIVGIESNVTDDVSPSTRPTNIVSTAATKPHGLKRAHVESDMSLTAVVKGGLEDHTSTTKAWPSPEVTMTLFF